MGDLSARIAGVTFKNPVIIGAGTATLNTEKMTQCMAAGAGGVVGKSVAYDPMYQRQPRPRFHIVHPEAAYSGKYFSLYSTELSAPFKPEVWVKEVKRAKKAARSYESVLIASIAGRDHEEWANLAQMMETAGADMIELNLSCPHVEPGEGALWGRVAGGDPKAAEDVVRVVREAVGIPIIGKLTPDGANPLDVARAMVKGGVDAVVSTARFQGLVIDPEEMRPPLWGGFGGYGGPWMVPLGCKWVARLMEMNLGVPVIGSGGIAGFEDAVRFMLVGAVAVQMCTEVVVRGYNVIRRTVGGVEEWMRKKGFESLEDFRARALKNIVSFEKLDRVGVYKGAIDESLCNGCGRCVLSCFYNAIQMVKKRAVVDALRCDGCGMCVAICPQSAATIIRQ